MTRPQSVLFLRIPVCGLVIIIKILISSTAGASPWPHNLISHLFIQAFFSSWSLLFYTKGVLVEILIDNYYCYCKQIQFKLYKSMQVHTCACMFNVRKTSRTLMCAKLSKTSVRAHCCIESRHMVVCQVTSPCIS